MKLPERWQQAGGELAARGIVVGLYVVLTRNLLTDYLQTGRLTGLLLLITELLVIVFTVVRRRALSIDRSMPALIVTSISVMGPLLVRAVPGQGLVPDLATTCASALGLSITIAAKLALGRSFGIVPANRGVVSAGVYRLVRHPIYAGHIITHLAFAVAHPIAWNVIVLAVADAALIVRALREERVLMADVAYADYCRRVAWHVVPGVF